MSIIVKIAERVPEVLNNVAEGAKGLVIAPNPNVIAPNPNVIAPMESMVSGLPFGQIALAFLLVAFTGFALWRNSNNFRKVI